MDLSSAKPSLPIELLQEIFQWTRFFRDPFVRMEIPVVLASVCSWWRSIVFNTPSLWSTIVVTHVVRRLRLVGNQPDDDQQVEFERIKFFLTHSRQSLLDIYVQLATSNRDKPSNPSLWSATNFSLRGSPKSSVSDLALILAPHAPRFRRFHVLSTRYSPVKELLATFPQVAMPCLEELHIDRVHRLHSQLHSDCPRTCPEPLAFLNIHHITTNDAQDYFHDNFPALKSIALASIPPLLPVFTPTHLTSLKMTLPQPELSMGLRNLLMANAHSLEKLSFMATSTLSAFEHRPQASSVSSQNLISFPLVKKLEISYADPDTFLPLISVLRFPSMSILRITNVQQTSTFPTKQFFEALLTSVPIDCIEELNLENIFTGRAQVSTTDTTLSLSFYPCPILNKLTSLSSLTLTGLDNHILYYLNLDINITSLDVCSPKAVSLPSLTHLHLIPTGGETDLENLVAFLQRRLSLINDACCPPLQDLTISGPSTWMQDLKAIDLHQLARNVLFLFPAYPQRSGGIWDDDFPAHSVVELSAKS